MQYEPVAIMRIDSHTLYHLEGRGWRISVGNRDILYQPISAWDALNYLHHIYGSKLESALEAKLVVVEEK